nr:hypothetical protein Iba_chr03aCG4950 [Ipomoea batatas]
MKLQPSITKLPFPSSGRSFEELVNGVRRRRIRPWAPLLQLPARQVNGGAAPLFSSTTAVDGTRNSYGGSGGNGGGSSVNQRATTTAEPSGGELPRYSRRFCSSIAEIREILICRVVILTEVGGYGRNGDGGSERSRA